MQIHFCSFFYDFKQFLILFSSELRGEIYIKRSFLNELKSLGIDD